MNQFTKAVCFLFVCTSVFGQLKISGKITPSPNWEKTLYVIRVDRINLHAPNLIDSILLKNDGTFTYTLDHNPQGMLYLFRLPQKGTTYKSVTSGTNDNYFLVSDQDQRPIEISAQADSLFYSLWIKEKSLNKDLLIFRNLKRPIFNFFKTLTDSIERYPEKKEEYRRSSFSKLMSMGDKLKRQVTGILDTARNTSFKLEGLTT